MKKNTTLTALMLITLSLRATQHDALENLYGPRGVNVGAKNLAHIVELSDLAGRTSPVPAMGRNDL